MKRQLMIFFLLMILLASGRAQTQNPTVTIPNINASPGKDVYLNISVTDVTGLQVFSVDFSLAYDTNLVQAIEVSNSATISAGWGSPTVNISAGSIKVSLAGIDPLSGSGNLVRIRFHVSEVAQIGSSSDLIFINFKFNDGQPVATIHNGSFTVTGDSEAPIIVSGPSIVERNYANVKISFQTDEPSRVLLLYGETTFYGQGASDPNLNKSHVINLTNLRETTDYHYQLQLTDSLNNGPRVLSGFTFRTKDVTLSLSHLIADPGTSFELPINVPDLSGLNLTKISLEILFDGTQMQVTGISTLNSLLSAWPAPQISLQSNKLTVQAQHTAALQGSGVLFKINGSVFINAVINKATDISFSNVALNDGQIKLILVNGSLTVKDRLPPIFISGPQVSEIRSNSAVIEWQTNEPATSLIEYGESTAYSLHWQQESFVFEHRTRLTELKPGTTYHIRAGSKDVSGNGPKWSSDVSFTTTSSDVTVGFSDTTAAAGSTLWLFLSTSDVTDFHILNWQAVLAYDPIRLQYVNVEQVGTMSENWHPLTVSQQMGFISIAATGSAPLQGAGKLVKIGFQVSGTSEPSQQTQLVLAKFRFDEGYPAVSALPGLITIIGPSDQQPPHLVWGPFVDNISSHSARLFWRTNEAAVASVEFGTSTNYDKNVDADQITTLHQILLTGLSPGTLYHYRVKNVDLAGNSSPFSADSTFSTISGNSVSISLNTASAAPGDVIEMPIQVSDVSGLEIFSSDIELAYDNDILSVVEANNSGCLTAGWGQPTYTPVSGQLYIAMGGINPLQGSGNLVKVKFQVSNSAQAGELTVIRFNNFIFNEGSPLATYKFGSVSIKDQLPPFLTAGPFILAINSTSALVCWQTNEVANARIFYGTSSPNEISMSNELPQTYHTIFLEGLIPATTYQYQIASQDTAGNNWISESTYQFTTSAIEPLLFDIARAQADRRQLVWIPVTVTGAGSRFIFSLDFDLTFDAAILQFQNFDLSASDVTLNWHKEYQQITPDRIHFHVEGEPPLNYDAELFKFQFSAKEVSYGSISFIAIEKMSVNGDSSHVTINQGIFRLVDLTPPIFASVPVVSQIRAVSAIISWQTDELTTAQLIYSPIGGMPDTIKFLTPAESINYKLTDLQPITSYQFQVNITDTSGNGPVWSELKQFATTAGNEVYIVLPDTAIAIGDTILLPIKIGAIGSIPISQYQFSLNYDARKVNFLQAIQTGSLTESWNQPLVTMVNDSLKIFHSAGNEITSAGILLFLQFVSTRQAKHFDTTSLIFSNFIFNSGAPPAAITNGWIHFVDRSAPHFRETPSAISVGLKSATIKIVTTEPSAVRLQYGTTTTFAELIEISLVDTLHLVKIENLLPNQLYFYQVEIRDSLNNGPTISDLLTFQTAEAKINLFIPDTTIAINSDFLLPVKVSSVTDFDIMQYRVVIQFDSAAVTIQGASVENSLSASWGSGNFSSNRTTIIFYHSGAEALQGSGVLFWLKFHLSASAPLNDSTEIHLAQAAFQNGLFPVIFQDGTIHFRADVVPEVQLSLPDTTVAFNAKFDLGISTSDVTGLGIYSYSFNLKFDSQLLGIENVSTNNCLTTYWPDPQFALFGDSLIISQTGSQPLAGKGYLLKLHFYIKPGLLETCQSALTFLDFLFNSGRPKVLLKNGSVAILAVQNFISGYVMETRSPFPSIPGATVVALDSGGSIAADTTSDSAGFFKLTHLESNMPYQLYANKNGYSPSDTVGGIFAGNKSVILSMLKQDGIISGKITDAESYPVPQAIISINDDFGHFGSANTDLAGTFHLSNLDRRYAYNLTATKYGFKNLAIENISILKTDTTLSLILEWQLGKISGKVWSNNSPLSEVIISLFAQSSGSLLSQKQTETNGDFLFDSLKTNTYLVTAQKTGFLTTPLQQVLNLAPGEEKFIEFSLRPFVIASLRITGESFLIPNDVPTEFSYAALTESGETIDYLENISWQLTPPAAGFAQTGVVYPDSQYIGPANLIVKESSTALTDTAELFLYAHVRPEKSYQLHDALGMQFLLNYQSVPAPFQLRFERVTPQSLKGSTRSHMIIGDGYDFKPDGITFVVPATLRLKIPTSYQNQKLTMGQWDPTRAEWHILPSSKESGLDQIEAQIDHFSLFALMLPALPLAVHDLKFAPNPFSPIVDTDGNGTAGVDISFYVTSQTIRQPFVTIKVYSLQGELVRSLLVNEPLDKAKNYSFNWDGKSDMDRPARNGRYLIQLEVKDQKETKSCLGQVVLIK